MTFQPIHVPGDLYFVTGTIVDWEPIFQNKTYTNIILDSLKWHRENQRMKIFAYVIMPNHLHWISLPLHPYSINNNIQSFGSYTAHEILAEAKNKKHHDLLEKFSRDALASKNHKIWISFQAKNIMTDIFLFQKMEYIHNNPIKKEWFTSDSRSDYQYSSACYYDNGIEPIIKIDDVYDYLDNLR